MAINNANRLTGYNLGASKGKSFYTGSYDTSRNLKNIDPYLTGYGQIFWVKLPEFMKQIFEEENLKNFTQKNFKELSGLSDIELQTANVTEGYGANELQFAGGIQKGNTEFTLKHQEFSGTPISKIFGTWVELIRDPETNIAPYGRLFDMDYTADNHTGELLYINTRPDVNNTNYRNIEFACLWTNVMPKRIPMGHYNFTQGTNDQVEIEIPFSGDFHRSPYIDALAYEMLEKSYDFQSLSMYDIEGTGDSIIRDWDNFKNQYYLGGGFKGSENNRRK